MGEGDAASARFAPRKMVADVKVTRDGWVLHAEVRFEGQWTLKGQTSPGKVAWVGEVTDIKASFSISLAGGPANAAPRQRRDAFAIA